MSRKFKVHVTIRLLFTACTSIQAVQLPEQDSVIVFWDFVGFLPQFLPPAVWGESTKPKFVCFLFIRFKESNMPKGSQGHVAIVADP
jgi:hypothetical protein